MKLKNLKIKSQTKKEHLAIVFSIVLLVVLLIRIVIPTLVYASLSNGVILSSESLGRAWSSNVGWINFGSNLSNIHITNTGLTGNARSSVYGSIDLAPVNGGVTNDGEGILGGYAWGDKLDWINFSGVSIDAEGIFHGVASGSLIGTLTFDCKTCDVRTDWRPVGTQELGNLASSKGDIFTSASIEAPTPPKTLFEEMPPLFDVSSEPAQSVRKNTVTSVIISSTLNILLIILIIFISRWSASYFMARVKLKRNINKTLTKQ